MTRAATIRQAISDAIEAVIPDTRATRLDVFRFLDAGSEQFEQAPDRTFQVRIAAQPQRIEVNNCDTWRVEYQVVFFFGAAQAGVEDRIASDAERIWGSLERLFETVAGVMRVDVAPLGLAEAGPSAVISLFSVVATYQLDTAVVTA